MALPTLSFTTGPATLPDVGTLFYNGCTFSPLFATNVSGVAVKDDAQRTVKYMEYTIEADGYVTLPSGDVTISPTMDRLRELLTAQGGNLVYNGRGCDINVNPGGLPSTSPSRDVAWGPVPDLLEFQPLGSGRSAKIRWCVKVRIPQVKIGKPPSLGPPFVGGGLASIPLLQFSYESVVSYNEDGFSTLTVSGILEIPLTRQPTRATRTVETTADAVRGLIGSRVMVGVDLDRFRMVRREFNISRDKRLMQWSFSAEEKPYMDLPLDCTMARGTYNVRPARAGMGLVLWLCTLRATYTVRNDRPRRTAWLCFLALLRHRMAQSSRGFVPTLAGPGSSPIRPPPRIIASSPILTLTALTFAELWREVNRREDRPVRESRRAWLMDFSFDEGLYLDSKTVSFSATWRLVTSFSHILLASGLWTKLPERDSLGRSAWATSVGDIIGTKSWLPNRLDPRLDVIVDFGGG